MKLHTVLWSYVFFSNTSATSVFLSTFIIFKLFIFNPHLKMHIQIKIVIFEYAFPKWWWYRIFISLCASKPSFLRCLFMSFAHFWLNHYFLNVFPLHILDANFVDIPPIHWSFAYNINFDEVWSIFTWFVLFAISIQSLVNSRSQKYSVFY